MLAFGQFSALESKHARPLNALETPTCRDDAQKQSIFQHVLGAVEINSSETPEDYLTERTKGFGVPEAFIQMRNNCSPEITAAAYLPGGVLDGCVTPVYDDWTIHQALRILAGMQPLDKESNKMVELHLTLLSECIKFVFAIDESPGDYCSEVLETACTLLVGERKVFHPWGVA